jgi:hypothetical protein
VDPDSNTNCKLDGHALKDLFSYIDGHREPYSNGNCVPVCWRKFYWDRVGDRNCHDYAHGDPDGHHDFHRHRYSSGHIH